MLFESLQPLEERHTQNPRTWEPDSTVDRGWMTTSPLPTPAVLRWVDAQWTDMCTGVSVLINVVRPWLNIQQHILYSCIPVRSHFSCRQINITLSFQSVAFDLYKADLRTLLFVSRCVLHMLSWLKKIRICGYSETN